jgi:hypothetical protein
MEKEWLNNNDEKYRNENKNNDHNYRNSQYKSNSSFSNNLNNNNPVVRSDDYEESHSKNINYSKVSLDDPFKDSKRGDKKFVELNQLENLNQI